MPEIFFVVPFLALRVQLVVLVNTSVMVSTVWSVYCLLFFYSRCPPCPAICKSGAGGGTCLVRAPMESAPIYTPRRKVIRIDGAVQQATAVGSATIISRT